MFWNFANFETIREPNIRERSGTFGNFKNGSGRSVGAVLVSDCVQDAV
jgi:hypothetical protein